MDPLTYPLLNKALFLAIKYGVPFGRFWIQKRLGLFAVPLLMAFLNRRYNRAYRRAWPMRRGRKRKRAAPVIVRKPKRGFVPRYRKKAFVGRPFGVKMLLKCIESKKFITTDNNPITLTHTAGSDHQYFFAPTQGMTQGTTDSQFTGRCIWIKGISYKCFFGPVATDNDSYHIRFMAVRTRNNVNYSSSAWTETADADTSFYNAVLDVDYATVTERMMLLAPPSRNSTIKVLYDKRIHISNTNTAAGTNQRFFRIWLPLNQLHNWQTDVNDDMTNIPNFGSQGDILFVLIWDNGSHLSGGTKKSLVLGGQTAVVYFKDA